MDSRSRGGSAPTDAPRLVNGIFQGGGAKLIAYVGAFRAMREQHLWFGSVAGSSAGAITAALIASGMGPDELEAAIPDGLAAAKSPIAARLGLAALGRATSLFEGAGLRRWLDRTLASNIGREQQGPITFRQLHEATGIELYVITLDLATELPVVFSRRTTPDVEVAGAVVASGAIPAAFPAGRAVFGHAEGGARVHQLIDGSGWANYPSFVFQDRSFRAWLRAESALVHGAATDTGTDDEAWSDESARPVVGFVFGEPDPIGRHRSIGFVPLDGPDVNRRFDLGPTYTSRKRLTHVIGATLSSDWARVMVALALLVWISLSVATLPIAFRRFSTWLAEWVPEWLFPLVLVASLTVAVLAIVLAIGTIALLMLASRLLADTLLPAIKATMGVPLDVPPWVGLGDDSVVVHVPHGSLKTIDFDVDPVEQADAVAAAEIAVTAQLTDRDFDERLDALFAGRTGRPAAPRPVTAAPDAPAPPASPTSSPAIVTTIMVVATVVIGLLAWWATTSAGSAGIVEIVAVLVVAIAGVAFALRYIGNRTGRRAHQRASIDADATSLPPHVSPTLLASIGIGLLVAGAALSFVAMDDHSDTTLRAEVVEATDGGDADNSYELEVDGRPDHVPVASARHLRLGERVFVEWDRDTDVYALVGPLDDARFGASIVLWALGVGALTSAVRSRRWVTRCRRLDDVVSGFAAARRER